jgi:hypothetical protein
MLDGKTNLSAAWAAAKQPAKASTCLGCAHGEVELLIDLGAQPPSNRFLRTIEEPVERHAFRVGQCRDCALLQLIEPMPVKLTRPRVGWLSYNEPEAHLDSVCERLWALPGMPRQPRVLGLSYKDDSTLARLARVGAQTYRFDLAADWNVCEPHAQLETLQQAVTPERAALLARSHGPADMLIARHILEHAHRPRAFLEAVLPLVKPGGCVVFEVPAAEKMIATADHALLWEEHVVYFTNATLERFFRAASLQAELWRYTYVLEDSLLAIVRNVPTPSASSVACADEELEAGKALGAQFAASRAAYHAQLDAWRAHGKRIALFGAGHLALKFMNFYGLSDLIHCVIDDNPNKQGTYLPGSCLPVVGSSILRDGGIDFCLMALNPDREAAIISSHASFTTNGGSFYSIFRCSPIALRPSSASSR